MAQIVVRNLDESVKRALKRRAKARGSSMEAEARAILEATLMPERTSRRGLGSSIRARFAAADMGIEMESLAAEKLRPAKLPK
jgi:plasmid stability protein